MVAGVVFTLIGIGFLLESLAVWTVDLVYVWPVMLIGIGISFLLGRAKRQRIEEDRSAKLAVAEERVRIARELHDIVAHGVSLMTIQIAAARRVATRQPEAADQALAAAEQAGRQSLDELRSLLAVLRSADVSLGEARVDGRLVSPVDDEAAPMAPLPRLTDLNDLVDNLRSAGLSVSLDVDGLVPVASAAIELTAYRVVQESLTNVVRHAPRARAAVRVRYAPDAIHLVVEDDGAGLMATTATLGTDGHGLLGMRERVAAVGGFLAAGPRRDGPGWRVEATLPLHAVVGA